jgi:cytochrome c-type biogenesis protein CcmH
MVMFWALASALCLATLGLLLAGFRGRSNVADDRGDAALAIYKDQLAELEREQASGVISTAEAEGQRTEISRRLLAASKELGGERVRTVAFPKWIAVVVPVVAAAIYWQVGRIGLADVPRVERLSAAQKVMDEIEAGKQPDNIDMPAVIALIEKRVEDKPDEVASWQFLAGNYLSEGRFGDAANAFERIISISGPSAELYANLAEALVFQNKGLLTTQSVAAAKEALKLDPKHPKARYYDALGAAQDGKREEARKSFEALLAESPANAPWRRAVETQIANLSPQGTAPKISDDQMQAGADMSPEERMTMIRGMVDGLDAKLKTNPQDIEGWLRVIRARTVLNENDKALAALATARQTFAGKADETKLIDALAQELNLK